MVSSLPFFLSFLYLFIYLFHPLLTHPPYGLLFFMVENVLARLPTLVSFTPRVVEFKSPPSKVCLEFAHLVSLREGSVIPPEDIFMLVDSHPGDLRRILLELQFWSQNPPQVWSRSRIIHILKFLNSFTFGFVCFCSMNR